MKTRIGTPLYTTQWTVSRQKPAEWKNIFLELHNYKFDRLTSDLIYKVIHNGIKNRIKLEQISKQPTDIYPRCNTAPETTNHLFFHCEKSMHLSQQVRTLYLQIKPNKNFDIIKLIIEGDKNPTIQELRMNYIKTIWYCRNQTLFENKTLNHEILFKNKLTSSVNTRYKINKQNREMIDKTVFQLFSLKGGKLKLKE